MLDKLKKISLRFEELELLLAAPETLKNPARLKEVGKEYAELRPVMGAYSRYQKTMDQLEQARELDDDPDPEFAALAREEAAELLAESEELLDGIKALLAPKDPLDGKNIILEIRAGTGGEEAALFARELYDAYRRFGDSRSWRTETLSLSPAEQGGVKEIVAQMSGKEVFGALRFESGVHRVQRVPVTESQGRVHTSAVTVAVLPEAEEVDLKIDEADLKVDTYRSQGAGGQHVNTTDSAVRITHQPSGLVVVCQDERSQHKNRAKAMKILRARLLDLERRRLEDERSAMRKGMVKSGDRSEKIRTYNFPQGRVTDHRINLTLYKLDRVMEGEFTELVEALAANYRAEQLAGIDPDEAA